MTAAEIKAKRISLGYSIRGLAAALECSPSTVSRWESGQAVPQPPRMLELALWALEHQRDKNERTKHHRKAHK